MPYDFRRNTGNVIELNFVAGRPWQLIHETLSIARVLQVGLKELQANPSLVEALRKEVRQTASGGNLLSGDLHSLHSIVVVNICAALEAGVEDTLVIALRFRPGMIKHLELLGLSKLPAVYDRDLTYVEAEVVQRKLETRSRNMKLRAPGGWLQQLSDVGLPITLSDNQLRGIRELIYVRNCIIHRAAKVDEDWRAEMSFLKPEENGKIHLTLPAMGVYSDAAMALASAIAEIAQNPVALQS